LTDAKVSSNCDTPEFRIVKCKCHSAKQFEEIVFHLRQSLDSLRQDLIGPSFQTRSALSLQKLQCSQSVQTEENKKNRLNKFISKQCPICLEYLYVLGWETLFVWPCGHIYCEKCSNRLVSYEPTLSTCSVCRKVVETDAIHRVF